MSSLITVSAETNVHFNGEAVRNPSPTARHRVFRHSALPFYTAGKRVALIIENVVRSPSRVGARCCLVKERPFDAKT